MPPCLVNRAAWGLAALVAALCPCRAQNPTTIPFQGRVTDASGTPLPDGTYSATFTLYDNPLGIFLASNETHTFAANTITLNHAPVVANSETMAKSDGTVTYTRGSAYTINNATGVITRANATVIPNGTTVKVSYEYTAASLWTEGKSVAVRNGFLSTSLGSVTAFPSSLAFDQPLYLGIRIGADPEMTPRIAFGAAPFAFTVADGSVGSVKLASDPASLHLVSGGAMTSDGANVGIGTTTPARQLEIERNQSVVRLTTDTSVSGSVLEMRNNAASPTLLGGINFLDAAGAVPGQIAYRGEDALTFNTNAAERLRIDSIGRLGVGTTSPTRDVEIQSTGDVEVGLKSKDANGRLWTLQSSAAPSTGGTNGDFQIIDRTVPASRLAIDSAGNVGIGTTAPAAKLDVNGAVRVDGALSRTYGSSAYFNATPIAMAAVDLNGHVVSGTPNVSCTLSTSGGTSYFITVSGENAANSGYIPMVTAGTNVSVPIAIVGTFGSQWNVVIKDGVGNTQKDGFSFMLYKP